MSILSRFFNSEEPVDISSIIDSIKAEIIKIQTSPFAQQLEKVALHIVQNVEPATLQDEIHALAKIYAQLKPIENVLKATFPQYATLFVLLDQVIAILGA